MRCLAGVAQMNQAQCHAGRLCGVRVNRRSFIRQHRSLSFSSPAVLACGSIGIQDAMEGMRAATRLAARVRQRDGPLAVRSLGQRRHVIGSRLPE